MPAPISVLTGANHTILSPSRLVPGSPVPEPYPIPVSANKEDALALHEQAINKHKATGGEVVYREPNQLLIDLDTTPFPEFLERLQFFSKNVKVKSCTTWESKTPGHNHVVVELEKSVANCDELAAFQSMLGSDYKREILTLRNAKTLGKDMGVLFKPAGAKEYRFFGA